MDSLPEEVLTFLLAKVPLKSITTSKLVCKKWKSTIDSKLFYHLFQSHHQNSHSLWSLMCTISRKEVVAHYECNDWGLTESLGSYISSFIKEKFELPQRKKHWLDKEEVRVVAYTDVGLVLFSLTNPVTLNITYYVGNPISRQCVKIPPLTYPSPTYEFIPFGLVTNVENGIVLGYKVILMNNLHIETCSFDVISLLIFSSETGLWSLTTLRSSVSFSQMNPISLNGNLYWIGINSNLKNVVVCHNFYATCMESDQCRVIPFPGEDKEKNFRRVCTTSQGSLVYMKIVSENKGHGNFDHKLSVWRLKGETSWQLVSEVSPGFIDPGFDHIQLTVNPFDAKTVYFWSKMQNRLASINLDKCKTGLHNFECSCSNGCKLSVYEFWYFYEGLFDKRLSMFAFPRWLYRIPSSPSGAM